MLKYINKFITIIVFSSIATSASAEEVNLISLDGGITISGEFVDYDGNFYTIKNFLGELTVDAFLVRCEGDACPIVATEPSKFEISAPPKIAELFADLLFEFSLGIGGETVTALNPDGPINVTVKNQVGDDLSIVEINSLNTVDAFGALWGGAVNMIATTRPITDNEQQAFISAQLGDLTTPEQQTIFALDGLVIVTSRSNPIRAISEADIARIFAGQVTNWKQIGGVDANINVYTRDESSGTGVVFNNLVMAPAGLRVSETATILPTDSDVSAEVASDPLGIGVASISDVGNAKVLDIRGTCGIQVPATPFTIKTEEYPLTRRLYTYTANTELPAHLDSFVEFLNTESAQNAIANRGFVDLGVAYQSNDEQGLRYLSAVIPRDVEMSLGQLREMTTNLMAADRLSITYRFALGSSRLDQRAVGDIARLADLLSISDLNNKELLLIGFTDTIGTGSHNTVLSRQRASEVRNALLDALPEGGIKGLPIQTLGFGEISPLACNDSPNGRRINRRVEVWLRDSITVSR